jgi:hypothetical protein
VALFIADHGSTRGNSQQLPVFQDKNLLLMVTTYKDENEYQLKKTGQFNGAWIKKPHAGIDNYSKQFNSSAGK